MQCRLACLLLVAALGASACIADDSGEDNDPLPSPPGSDGGSGSAVDGAAGQSAKGADSDVTRADSEVTRADSEVTGADSEMTRTDAEVTGADGEIIETPTDAGPVPQPQVSLAPEQIEFPDLAPGQSADRIVRLANLGDGVLAIVGLEGRFGAEFELLASVIVSAAGLVLVWSQYRVRVRCCLPPARKKVPSQPCGNRRESADWPKR